MLFFCPGSQTARAEGEKDYITHIVKWYEDLGTIAEKYGMGVEVIMAYNGLTEAKVSRKQVLRIPLYPEKVVISTSPVSSPTEENSPQDGRGGGDAGITSSGEEPAAEDELQSADSTAATKRDRVSLALALPLVSGDKPNDSNYDFYCGALLAAKLMAESGVSVDLDVRDISEGGSPDFSGKD